MAAARYDFGNWAFVKAIEFSERTAADAKVGPVGNAALERLDNTAFFEEGGAVLELVETGNIPPLGKLDPVVDDDDETIMTKW